MKRNEMTVGMIVAVKHGYSVKQATVASLDKHRVGYSGRILTGQGTGLLVQFVGGFNEGDKVVVQPQAVLGEWDAYEVAQKAEQKARAERAAIAADLTRRSTEAEVAAVARADALGLRVSREFSSYGGRVSMDAEQLQALLDALPQGTTFAPAAR